MDKQALGDSLFEQERISAPHREKYEREVRKMLDQEITNPMRMGLAVGVVAALTTGLAVAVAAVHSSAMPLELRGGMGICAVVALGYGAFFLKAMLSKVVDRKRFSNTYASMPWVIAVLVGTMALTFGPTLPGEKGVIMIASALFFLIGALSFLVQNWIRESEVNTGIKLAEIELKLAEIAESLQTGPAR